MIKISRQQIRKEINRIRNRLGLAQRINDEIYRIYSELQQCAPPDHPFSSEPLKMIPFLFFISLNANAFFISADTLPQISYVNINEVMSVVEPLYRYDFDSGRVSSQNIRFYSFTFEKFARRYSDCPLCEHALEEGYLRLFYLEHSYLRETLRNMLIEKIRKSDTFEYVFDRRITVKIPCILCLFDLISKLTYPNLRRVANPL
jgi:hypothetical protein